MFKNYRLGIDMGSTSLGWCMLELGTNNEPQGIINMGVRIFPDGREDKSKEPLSVARRGFRSIRRNHDRYLLRLRSLLNLFENQGFMPQDTVSRRELFAQNPYFLRARALESQLSLGEIARALIHLAKRRGFLSNRKSLDDKDASAFKQAIENLREMMISSGVRTLGEYRYRTNASIPEQHKRRPLKFRYEKTYSDEERIFPQRSMVIDEFNLIWDTQAQFHPEMTPELRSVVFDCIFFQRPLKAQIVGNCIFEETEPRAHKAQPLFQEFRLLQDINNLKVTDLNAGTIRNLSADERNTLFDTLQNAKEKTFSDLRKKLFAKASEQYRFNLETENRKKLLGNQTNYLFHATKNQDLKPLWNAMSLSQRQDIISILTSDRSDEDALKAIKSSGVAGMHPERWLELYLPDGHGNISLKALEKIIPYMRAGMIYSDACTAAGYKHSLPYEGLVFEDGKLPYYGELLRHETLPLSRPSHDPDADEWGKINNPTVHIALNQLRQLVNALAKKYGAPQQIVLELARDLKMGNKEKELYEKRLHKQTKDNERISEELHKLNIPNNGENRARFRLWEELAVDPMERRCIYTGKLISISELFSSRFEIEHILPKSRTFDDSSANKTLSFYEANRYKGERSPYEAFGNSSDGYDWQAITNRAALLPQNKRRRFLKDAMDWYADENEVLARMLNDTRYMSRTARKYMSYVCGESNVYVITGHQTSQLRGKWGLNKALNEDGTNAKNRTDHRHHAIDAFVIAMTSRSSIQRFTTSVKLSRERYLENLPMPWEGFAHDDFISRVHRITVSYKPDQINASKLHSRHQTAGALVKETAFSCMGPASDDPKYSLYVTKKSISGLGIKHIESIKSPELRRWIMELNGANTDDKVFKSRLLAWAEAHGVKKLKMIEKCNPQTMIPVLDKEGNAFKYYASGENLYADIYQIRPGDPECKWNIEIVNSYNAHQEGFVPEWKQTYPMAKLIMRLFKNDIVALDSADGSRELRRVRKMSKGTVYLRELNIVTKPKGSEDIGEGFPPNSLFVKQARKAGVDIIGRYFDPIVNEQHEHH